MSKQKSKMQLFEEKQVRTVWDEDAEKWWFSIVDVCAILTDSADSAAYWRKLKQRLIAEGNETVTNCHALKMLAKDGRMRLTDVADTEQVLRLIQSIPSKKAEPFKLWLAKVGNERLDEIAESSTTDFAKEKNPQGMSETAKVAKQGGSVAKAAREEYELQYGKLRRCYGTRYRIAV